MLERETNPMVRRVSLLRHEMVVRMGKIAERSGLFHGP
jgi:hypothetical protein